MVHVFSGQKNGITESFSARDSSNSYLFIGFFYNKNL